MYPSPFTWPGGKSALTKTLLTLLPEHRIYVEEFAGSAKLLFAKGPSRAEVWNDLSGEVIEFLRVRKYRTAGFADEARRNELFTLLARLNGRFMLSFYGAEREF